MVSPPADLKSSPLRPPCKEAREREEALDLSPPGLVALSRHHRGFRASKAGEAACSRQDRLPSFLRLLQRKLEGDWEAAALAAARKARSLAPVVTSFHRRPACKAWVEAEILSRLQQQAPAALATEAPSADSEATSCLRLLPSIGVRAAAVAVARAAPPGRRAQAAASCHPRRQCKVWARVVPLAESNLFQLAPAQA
jgi:hypothetical protein